MCDCDLGSMQDGCSSSQELLASSILYLDDDIFSSRVESVWAAN